MRQFALMLACAWAVSGVAWAADAKEEVQQAAKKLQEKGNYSWKSSSESAGGQNRFQTTTEGKTEKGGVTLLSLTFGENTTEAVLKEGKGAVKTQEGWQSLSELSSAEGQNRGRFLGRMLQNFKAPADQAAELAGKVKELKKADDAYTGELTEEGLRDLATFGRRGNDNPLRNGSGTVKFWIKDGVLSKFEYSVKGTVTFNDNDVDIDRTTTVEIKDVDSTKVTVPEEAKGKLS